jgi:hypothetical protein
VRPAFVEAQQIAAGEAERASEYVAAQAEFVTAMLSGFAL